LPRIAAAALGVGACRQLVGITDNQKVVAATKAKATREARHTMGAKQKKSVTGTTAAAAAAAPVATTAAVPPAAAPKPVQ
jgi:hypothetical protein